MEKDNNIPVRISSISELHKILNLPKPLHPMISLVNNEDMKISNVKMDGSFLLNFYKVSYKYANDGKMGYGQSNYDFSEGGWINQKWKNKLAAGFTISGAKSGDKLHTLQYLNLFAMQHGMLWVSLGELPGQSNGINNLGSWIGVMAVAQNESTSVTPSIEDKNTAEILGHRVARLSVASKF